MQNRFLRDEANRRSLHFASLRSNGLWLYPRTSRRVPHISLVFREMWDTAGLAHKPFPG
jgi:hypothetical protein